MQTERAGWVRLVPAVLVSLGLLAGMAAPRAALADRPRESDAARQRVLEFEQTLRRLPEAERPTSIRNYFAGLKDADTRIAAISMLDSRYVYVVPRSMMDELLAPLLKDPDAGVRLRAVHALAYNALGGRHAEVLRSLLNSDDVEMQDAALHAMGRSKDPQFQPLLREYLSHPVTGLRVRAALSLWSSSPEDKALEPLLHDPNADVRSLVAQLMPRREDARQLLKDPVPVVRQRIARALGDDEDRQVAPRIAPLLSDADASVRAEALYALGRLKAVEFGGEIEKLLKDADVGVRRRAAQSLADLRSAKHLPALRAALNDEDEPVRRFAARAIKLIEDPTLHPDLVP